LREGVFLHPSSALTFYIREITSTGELKDVLLADHRSKTTNIIYSAETAYLLREGERSMLIMVNGLAQRYQQNTNSLSTTLFSDLSYDVSNLVGTQKVLKRGLNSISSYEMVVEKPLILQETNKRLVHLHKEVHSRIQEALLCIVAAFIGFATLLLASFSRFGSGPQILLAIMLLIVIKLTESALGDVLRGNPSYWPLIYGPTLVGGAMSYVLLALAARPFKHSIDLPDQDTS
jgi:lipopolysaccharide export system permease protein